MGGGHIAGIRLVLLKVTSKLRICVAILFAWGENSKNAVCWLLLRQWGSLFLAIGRGISSGSILTFLGLLFFGYRSTSTL